MRRVRAIVTGIVQGVAFRVSTMDEARRLGVVGWVKNRPDGSVELEAEGPETAITALLAWCGHGPPHARVDKLSVEDVPVIGTEPTFSITR